MVRSASQATPPRIASLASDLKRSNTLRIAKTRFRPLAGLRRVASGASGWNVNTGPVCATLAMMAATIRKPRNGPIIENTWLSECSASANGDVLLVCASSSRSNWNSARMPSQPWA